MKKIVNSIIYITTVTFTLFISCLPQNSLQNGDIIFQISNSSQSIAIQNATDSKYSHMGIIYILEGKAYVYEAVQPVKLTPLQEWIDRGINGHYVVKRLKNSKELLTEANLLAMKTIGERYLGKPYDIYFQWSDESIYCSELVWKIYNEVLGINIGELKTIDQFDLSSPEVQKIMKKRFPNGVPMDEEVISPGDMFDSELLYEVMRRGEL